MKWITKPGQDTTSIKKRFLSFPTLVSFMIGIAALLFLTTRLDIDLGQISKIVKEANIPLFLLALFTHYTTFLFRGARWRVLLINIQGSLEKGRPNVLYCSSLVLLGWFTNSILWFRLGDAYRAYAYVEDTKESFPGTMGTVLAERTLDMFLVAVLLSLAGIVLLITGVNMSWVVVVMALCLSGLLALLLFAMWIFRNHISRMIPGGFAPAYTRFHEGTFGSFRRVPVVSLLGILGWLSEIGRLYFVTQALGVELGVPLVIFAALANSMLTLIPLTPGGLGVVEGGLIGLLLLSSGINTEAMAFAVVTLDRSISWASIIVVGTTIFIARQCYSQYKSRDGLSQRSS